MVILLSAVLVLTTSGAHGQDRSTLKPGQVLSESSTGLGNGYRQVERSQVNPPQHWEAVGHCVLVYFKDKRLCQCSTDEIALSPDGRFAVFVNEDSGRLMLFHAATSDTTALSDTYIGTSSGADWDVAQRRALVKVKRWVKAKSSYEVSGFQIKLEDTIESIRP